MIWHMNSIQHALQNSAKFVKNQLTPIYVAKLMNFECYKVKKFLYCLKNVVPINLILRQSKEGIV